MENNTEQKPQMQMMELLQSTPAVKIGELDIVKKKFVENYNLCHRAQDGELVYHRNLVFFKQLITESKNQELQKVDKFTLYAAFITCAVNNYSLDPADEEVYLVPLAGKAKIWRQAGALVKRLKNTKQVVSVDQVQLVYQGDEFRVQKGRVIEHIESFKSDVIIAGYVRFVIDDRGNDKFIIYRPGDWNAWRDKNESGNRNGSEWNSGANRQPGLAFLRTKIMKHASKDKSWATGMTVQGEQFMDVEVDQVDGMETPLEDVREGEDGKPVIIQSTDAGNLPITEHQEVKPKEVPKSGVNYKDDDF